MTKNPFYNAMLAVGYIALIDLAFQVLSYIPSGSVDNALAPMGMLSLLTLSAAIMACLFFYQPVIYMIEGKKSEAALLIAKTIGTFALMTALVFGVIFLISLF